jgi:hypothetical protein
MSNYLTLINILDRIRNEALGTASAKTYLPDETNSEYVNQARARAFIHLYLMVKFGLLDFKTREKYITDKAYDGGIDGYFIDSVNRNIYLIQSKFRTTEQNFKYKEICLEELLSMDITRILSGHETDAAGNKYNGKIKQLIREISEISDIARYHYKVILLANLKGVSAEQLKRLTDGHPVEVFDFEKCYLDLVFPVVSGTYFNDPELNIYLDLSNKNAGTKISYAVKTEHGSCDITVLFVPTIEIAKVLSKYKNSILKNNPRSYLDLEGKKVNEAIRETILNKSSNEFALFNNGITMISDDTNINERIGQQNKAQLAVLNPQIINGGQTAYTLSQIFEEHTLKEAEKIFASKEVLLKVITLVNSSQLSDFKKEKLQLVEAISTATNQQTAVINADRISNESEYEQIQTAVFSRYGVLFERKRGEFGDGLKKGYIKPFQVVERNLFFRVYLASNGNINESTHKKIFLNFSNPLKILDDLDKLDNFYYGLLCFNKLNQARRPNQLLGKQAFGKIYGLTRLLKPKDINDFQITTEQINEFEVIWGNLLSDIQFTNTKFVKEYLDRDTQEKRTSFSHSKWMRSDSFEEDIKSYFDNLAGK